MNVEGTKAEKVRESIASAIHNAFEEDVEAEVLLNKWAFVADVLIDGERARVTVWDESVHPMDLESLIRPTLRMAEEMSDMYSIGQSSGTLDSVGPGGAFMSGDDGEEDEEDEY